LKNLKKINKILLILAGISALAFIGLAIFMATTTE